LLKIVLLLLSMAAKNSVKTYVENAFYHVYNQGVEQRNIFLDQQDYSVFLSYLQTYVSPKDTTSLYSIISSLDVSSKEKDRALKLLKLRNYHGALQLCCYALLPNHFHLLLLQIKMGLNEFMNSLGTRYAMYFNRKYRRKGVLFQDVYKAVLVYSDEQLLHISRYIHQNPTEWLNLPPNHWRNLPYPSSLPDYLGERRTIWVTSKYVLDYFSKTNPQLSYESFVTGTTDNNLVNELTIDLEN